ncbi:MAG: SDR family oxidoreductase [Thermoproteota archaeon]|nr:SDR family oxidoreductase [Thermoproteota archaeon]
MGSNNKQQFEGCFSFCKSCSSIYDFKALRSHIKCQFWCWQGRFFNLSAYCASKFGLVGLAESLALEVSEYRNIRVLTIFPGEVATKMWQEYDFSYYQRNRTKMLQPKDVAEKIAEMIFDAKTYKNGDSVEMYNNNI